jgi:hypothetical protein
MTEVHVCAPAPVEAMILRATCHTCGILRRILALYYEWYGPTWTCLRCGDSWNEDGRAERPFRRGWRKEAIRSAWRAYVRYLRSQPR